MIARPASGQLPRAVDAAALARTVRRLQSAAQPPWLHAEVGRRMADRLGVIRLQPPRVLDWWSHSGGSAAQLQQVYPKAELLLLEPDVPGCVAAVPPAPWWSLQRWRTSQPTLLSASQLQPACAELVWANMGLHRWADPQQAFQRWHQALAVEGFLMFSTLGPGSLTTLNSLYTQAGWPPPFAPFVDMHDLGDMLVGAGFADPVMDQETLTLTWPTPAAALLELRQLGGNAHPRRTAGLRTPRWRQRLLDALAQTSGDDGRVALGFEVIYGHAFKPLPRARMASTTHVAVDDLQRMARSRRPMR